MKRSNEAVNDVAQRHARPASETYRNTWHLKWSTARQSNEVVKCSEAWRPYYAAKVVVVRWCGMGMPSNEMVKSIGGRMKFWSNELLVK